MFTSKGGQARGPLNTSLLRYNFLYRCINTDATLRVSACVLVVPAFGGCQFPVYLWQSYSTAWSSRVQHGGDGGGGQEEKRWTSRTLYPAGDSINWTSRREIDVMASQLTIKAVTKAVCFDSSTNTSVICDRKDILFRVACLTVARGDTYRVYIHGGGQVNIFPLFPPVAYLEILKRGMPGGTF